MFVNVYLPSASSYCREDEFVDCLASIANTIMDLQYSDVVFGGNIVVDGFPNPLRDTLHLLLVGLFVYACVFGRAYACLPGCVYLC